LQVQWRSAREKEEKSAGRGVTWSLAVVGACELEVHSYVRDGPGGVGLLENLVSYRGEYLSVFFSGRVLGGTKEHLNAGWNKRAPGCWNRQTAPDAS
jgi:hypothetical protein